MWNRVKVPDFSTPGKRHGSHFLNRKEGPNDDTTAVLKPSRSSFPHNLENDEYSRFEFSWIILSLPFQSGSTNRYYGSCAKSILSTIRCVLDGDLQSKNIGSVKITKLANMREEMEVFVTNWEGSVPQTVVMATVKTR